MTMIKKTPETTAQSVNAFYCPCVDDVHCECFGGASSLAYHADGATGTPA